MRPIDADELKRKGCESCGMKSYEECKEYMGDCCFLKEAADNMPTLDVAPVVHAEWEEVILSDCMINYWKCSKCGKTGTAIRFKYCPNCGARMDGEKNEADKR